MPWYAVYETTTGKLVSLGTVLAQTLPANLTAKDLGLNKPPDLQMWDEATRSFVPRPAKVLVDRVAGLIADPVLASTWARLTPSQRSILQTRLGEVLGTYRYRHNGDTLIIDQDGN